jgi:hypothetical protein
VNILVRTRHANAFAVIRRSSVFRIALINAWMIALGGRPAVSHAQSNPGLGQKESEQVVQPINFRQGALRGKISIGSPEPDTQWAPCPAEVDGYPGWKREFKWQTQRAVPCCEMAVPPSELPPSSLSICRKWRERKTSQRAFFTCSHFNGSEGHPKLKEGRAAKDIAARANLWTSSDPCRPNISPRGKGYRFAGIMQFRDKASLDADVQHPAHHALLAWLIPLIDAIELDLRA